MYVRIVTFGLSVPAEDYARSAVAVAPAFVEWPGLLAKWWLGDAASGTYGGVYLFASREDADRSRDTEVFRGMAANPALHGISVREFDVLDAPTAVTAPSLRAA
ncbi:YdhR family protein [Modestobacter marinus]|uniref:YdhR family protein n=1 Tax=Modestobacter marinus TaxID=477641 RepID=UPI001C96F7E0|nr:YdhR family protein [Modestobacter marinus]